MPPPGSAAPPKPRWGIVEEAQQGWLIDKTLFPGRATLESAVAAAHGAATVEAAKGQMGAADFDATAKRVCA